MRDCWRDWRRVRASSASRRWWRGARRPRSFRTRRGAQVLLLRPPGDGKTYLSSLIATALHNSTEKPYFHAVLAPASRRRALLDRLTGAACHLRSGGETVLEELYANERRPVLVFDEIEKAHEKLMTSLLQAADTKGKWQYQVLDRATDGCPWRERETAGSPVLTSNCYMRELREEEARAASEADPRRYELIRSRMEARIFDDRIRARRRGRPQPVQRGDGRPLPRPASSFLPLTPDETAAGLRVTMDEVRRRGTKHNVSLYWTDGYLGWCAPGHDPEVTVGHHGLVPIDGATTVVDLHKLSRAARRRATRASRWSRTAAPPRAATARRRRRRPRCRRGRRRQRRRRQRAFAAGGGGGGGATATATATAASLRGAAPPAPARVEVRAVAEAEVERRVRAEVAAGRAEMGARWRRRRRRWRRCALSSPRRSNRRAPGTAKVLQLPPPPLRSPSSPSQWVGVRRSAAAVSMLKLGATVAVAAVALVAAAVLAIYLACQWAGEGSAACAAWQVVARHRCGALGAGRLWPLLRRLGARGLLVLLAALALLTWVFRRAARAASARGSASASELERTQKQLAVALAVAELEGAAAASGGAARQAAPRTRRPSARVCATLKDGETFSTELLPLEETEPAPRRCRAVV